MMRENTKSWNYKNIYILQGKPQCTLHLIAIT